MKTSERRQGDGIGTARAVLTLLDEHSAQDFGAAEEILGGKREIAQLVRMLRELKERQEAAEQPLTVETFVASLRKEILDLPLDHAALGDVFTEIIGLTQRILESDTREELVDAALSNIHESVVFPREEVLSVARLYLHVASRAGASHKKQALLWIRTAARRALAENIVALPAPHSLAQLRLRWAPRPLSFGPHETREQMAERLLKDVEGLREENDVADYTVELLAEGLRMPGESAIAATRRASAKKGKANGDR